MAFNRVVSEHEKLFTKFTYIFGCIGESKHILSGLAGIVQNDMDLSKKEIGDWIEDFDNKYNKCKNELKQALIDLKNWKEDVLDFLKY